MKEFHITLLLSVILTMPGFGQDNGKQKLILQLPETHRWIAEPFDEPDLWGVHYKGFVGDERYPAIELQQANMLNQQVEVSPQQIAMQTIALIKTFDDTAELRSHKHEEIDGDDGLFYSITTAKTMLLLFYRQSKTSLHSVELELHEDQLELISMDMWEKLFFSSLVSESS